MKIAISAVLFSNDTLIGAQRPRALAERLVQRGHEVTVFTPTVAAEVFAPPPEGVRLVELPIYAPQAALAGSQLPLWQRLVVLGSIAPTIPRASVLARPSLARIFGIGEDRRIQEFDNLNELRRLTTARVRAMLDAAQWARGTARTIDQHPGLTGGFDAILSTYGPFGSLGFGRILAKSNASSVRVTDIRDSMVKPKLLWTVRKALARAERKVLRESDVVTVVSEGVRAELLNRPPNRRFAKNLRVLPNGFQRRENGSRQDPALQSRLLRVGYTGQIYAGAQDPAPLFQAFATLREANTDVKFEVHYAGRQGHLMREFAAQFGWEESVIDHGFLPHDEAVALQARMDVLLVLSWNSKDSQGIISGKFGEYLAQEKPILALIAGDVPGAELGTLIRSMNVGHAFEEASGASGQAELAEYLRYAAQYAAEGEALPYKPVVGRVDEFDYDTITARLEELIAAARLAR